MKKNLLGTRKPIVKGPVYKQLSDDTVVRASTHMYFACCDCGLVHRVRAAADAQGYLTLRWTRIKSKTKVRRQQMVREGKL